MHCYSSLTDFSFFFTFVRTTRFGDWHGMDVDDDELVKQLDKEGGFSSSSSPRICFSWKPATLLVRVLQCRHLTPGRRLEPLITVKSGGVTEKTCQYGECIALGMRAQARLPLSCTTVVTITLAHRGTVANEMIGTAEVRRPASHFVLSTHHHLYSSLAPAFLHLVFGSLS